MNPMHHLVDRNENRRSTGGSAPRTKDSDTALTVASNLADRAKNLGDDVDTSYDSATARTTTGRLRQVDRYGVRLQGLAWRQGGGLVTLFLAGDVMLGRGVHQILPHPGDRSCGSRTSRTPAPWSWPRR